MTELQKAAKEGNKDGRETYFLASGRPDERRLGRPAGGAVRLARGARGVRARCVLLGPRSRPPLPSHAEEGRGLEGRGPVHRWGFGGGPAGGRNAPGLLSGPLFGGSRGRAPPPPVLG